MSLINLSVLVLFNSPVKITQVDIIHDAIFLESASARYTFAKISVPCTLYWYNETSMFSQPLSVSDLLMSVCSIYREGMIFFSTRFAIISKLSFMYLDKNA